MMALTPQYGPYKSEPRYIVKNNTPLHSIFQQWDVIDTKVGRRVERYKTEQDAGYDGDHTTVDELQTVFLNGRLVVDHKFADIRERASRGTLMEMVNV